jgi:hypothetical protein
MASIIARIILGVYRAIPEVIRLPVLLIGFGAFQVVVFRVFKGPDTNWIEIVAMELVIGLPLVYIIYTGADE